MNILHVCGFDPAADVVRAVGELRKYSKHRHLMVAKYHHPFQSEYQFPEAVVQEQKPVMAFRWADAVLYHHVGWEDTWDLRSKPCAFRNLCIYLEGREKFWTLPDYNAKSLDSYRFVSSSHRGARDFLTGDFRWLPDLLPTDGIYSPDLRQRPPCFSYIKHSNEISQEMFPGIKLQNLYHHPLLEVLTKRREEATVALDNVSDGHYGLAGMEAVLMGLPTIVYNHAVAVDQLVELGGNPFVQVENFSEAMEIAKELLTHSAHITGIRSIALKVFDPQMLIRRYWDPFLTDLCA